MKEMINETHDTDSVNSDQSLAVIGWFFLGILATSPAQVTNTDRIFFHHVDAAAPSHTFVYVPPRSTLYCSALHPACDPADQTNHNSAGNR